jgi:hypothetical protein
MAGLCVFPLPQQKSDLLFATNQRRQAGSHRNLEAVSRTTLSNRTEALERLGDAFQPAEATILALEKAVNQFVRGGTYHDRSGFGRLL